MIENIWFIVAFWMGLALVASLVSIRLGISVALIEILVGVIVGNIHFGQYHNLLRTTERTNFLAMLGSGVLTFLAGAEIDPASLRAKGRERGGWVYGACWRFFFPRGCCAVGSLPRVLCPGAGGVRGVEPLGGG